MARKPSVLQDHPVDFADAKMDGSTGHAETSRRRDS